MTKVAIPLARSSFDKCVARHPTCFLPLKPDPHKDSSSYRPPSFLKGYEEEKGSLHNFTRILLAMKDKEEKGTVIQQECVIYLSWLRHGR
jgi:hypothetical protein